MSTPSVTVLFGSAIILVMAGLLGIAFWAGELKERSSLPQAPIPRSSPSPLPVVPSPVPPPASPQLPPTDPPQEQDNCEWMEYRLPGWVIPIEYHLDLDVELKEPFAVHGRIVISLEVVQETRCVLIHGEAMEITSIKLHETDEEGGWTPPKFCANNTWT